MRRANQTKQPEMPKGIDAAFPAKIAAYMAAIERNRGRIRYRLKTQTQRPKSSAKARQIKAKPPR
jgi:hypothetical protein